MRIHRHRRLFLVITSFSIILFIYYFKSYYKLTVKNDEAENKIRMAIQLLPKSFQNIHCEDLASGYSNLAEIKEAENWTYQLMPDKSFTHLDPNERCNFLKTHYGFLEKASSDEELHYSLAYGILVHQNIDQVFYMLSAIYQPQNVYCIAVDGKATQTFWTSINYLKSCLPNITIIKVPVVKWCTYSVLHGVHTCLKNLSKSPYEWQYYQYLSNIDLPLRTNREMVRIFKKLNGSINAEVLKFQPFRLLGSKRPVPYNVTLFKSSLSATFSRKSANFFANSDEANAILRFLKSTYCPDESFWLTVAGNPKNVAMPGNFDGMKFLTMINNVAKQRRNSFYKDRSQKVYYISRYQLWLHGRRKCHGKWKRASCVFGVQDIRNLINQPHLVAHKFLLSVQPAAFFCIYKLVRERSLRDISDFNDGPYGNLPGPRITRGESVRNWFYDFHDNKSWYRY